MSSSSIWSSSKASTAGDGHAQGVADKVADVMVLEEGRVLGEDRALVGFFDIAFEGHESVFAGLVKQLIHHFQGVDVALLAELGAAENAGDAARNFLEDVQRIGDEHRSEGSAPDDDQFGGLDEHPRLPCSIK